MADLVTHLAVVLLPAAAIRPRLTAMIAIGTVLPDLLGRAVPLALERMGDAGLPVPGELIWPWAALHEPVGWLLSATLLASAFVRRDRAAVWRALCLGGAAHTALDVLQFHHGQGYLLLAPFSARTFELGWIGSEATVRWAPVLAVLTAIAWTARAWRQRSTHHGSARAPDRLV